MTVYSYDELRHIFIEINNGRNNHGSFLRAFADAFIKADEQNFELLRVPAILIVEKYNLNQYLDNYNQKEKQ